MENRNTNKSTALAAIAAALAQNNQTLQVMAEAIREHSNDIEGIRQEIISIKDSLVLHDKGLEEIQALRNALNKKPVTSHSLRKQNGREAYFKCDYKPSIHAADVVVRTLLSDSAEMPDVKALITWFDTQCRVIAGYLYGRYNWKVGSEVRRRIYGKFEEITNGIYAEWVNKDGARCVKLFKNRVTAEYLLCATLEVLEAAIMSNA